jgi:hypothetical protein
LKIELGIGFLLTTISIAISKHILTSPENILKKVSGENRRADKTKIVKTTDRLISTFMVEREPPKWVLYQRQLDSLKLHELIYNQGNPLLHRDLDQMIKQKFDAGMWQIAYTSNYEERPGWSNEWILIRTRP